MAAMVPAVTQGSVFRRYENKFACWEKFILRDLTTNLQLTQTNWYIHCKRTVDVWWYITFHRTLLKEIRVKNICASGQSLFVWINWNISSNFSTLDDFWNEKITLAWTDSSFGPYSNVQQLAKISPAVKWNWYKLTIYYDMKYQEYLFKPIYNRTFPYTILIYYNLDNPNVFVKTV